MSERKRLIPGILCMILAVLIAGWGMFPIRIPSAAEYKGTERKIPEILPVETFDDNAFINTAGIESLPALPGIGKVTAEAIITERTENGMFRYPEDLLSVNGIGAKKLEKLLPELGLNRMEGEE